MIALCNALTVVTIHKFLPCIATTQHVTTLSQVGLTWQDAIEHDQVIETDLFIVLEFAVVLFHSSQVCHNVVTSNAFTQLQLQFSQQWYY